MTTRPKKSRPTPPGMTAAAVARASETALPSDMDGDRIVGELPGDEEKTLFWESRVAAWLGMPRRRLVELRRGRLHQTADWVLRAQEVVYTVRGVEKLRALLPGLRVRGLAAKAPTPPKPAEDATATPAAPSGPLQRTTAKVVRVFPNRHLMLCQPAGKHGNATADAAVLVRVRDNLNFTPGMALEIVHDVRGACWQFQGRLPRRKGRW